MDAYGSGDKVKLYDIPNNTWIIWAGCRIFFEKIDGMYAKCKDARGNALLLDATAEVTIDE